MPILYLMLPAVSSVPRNFIPGRDGIQVQSRDPGIFRDGISLIFSSRDFLEIVRDFSGLTFFDAISATESLKNRYMCKEKPKGRPKKSKAPSSRRNLRSIQEDSRTSAPPLKKFFLVLHLTLTSSPDSPRGLA